MKQKVITLIIILVIILVIKWILVFPWFFLQFGLGGAGVQIVETCIFLRGTVMKASSHEKHSKQQWKKKFRPMGKVWREAWQGTWVWTFYFFCFSMVFCSLAKTSRTQKKTKSSDPWARSGLSTHKPKNQKTKKPKNQKTKKPKNQKNQTNQDCTPQGEGVRCRVLGLVFLVFWLFCFFVFLVFPWFFAVWPKPREHKKKQKVQTHGQGLGYPHTNQKNKKPKNQETKKPKNQKTKKPKKPKKPRLHTPRGGGQMQSVGSCFFFLVFFGFLVFWFFGLCVDSHCRCAKQRLPGTVSGCTRSKVDTL